MSLKASMRFERNFTPGLIGRPLEDHDQYYKDLQRQPIDTSKCETWAFSLDDFKNSREIYIYCTNGTITIDKETVFPKDAMTIPADSPLAREVWKDNSFHLVIPKQFGRKEVNITGQETKIYLDGKSVYPKNELK